MMEDSSKIRRYELKYTITEELAAEIKDYVKSICSLDKHVPQGETGYVVNNLYFDTPDLRFYTDTKHRKLTRYKPRARYYGLKPGDLIWPEIKYRQSSIIWKKRYTLPIKRWPELFCLQKSKRTTPEFKEQMDRFEEVIYWHGAEPVMHVRYFREPYVTELEEYGRVTFDRQLCYRPARGSIQLDYNEEDMLFYDDAITTLNYESPVLLEIKIETLVPYWASELVRKFNLMQRPFSKYCYAVDHAHGYITGARNSIFK